MLGYHFVYIFVKIELFNGFFKVIVKHSLQVEFFILIISTVQEIYEKNHTFHQDLIKFTNFRIFKYSNFALIRCKDIVVMPIKPKNKVKL